MTDGGHDKIMYNMRLSYSRFDTQSSRVWQCRQLVKNFLIMNLWGHKIDKQKQKISIEMNKVVFFILVITYVYAKPSKFDF